MHPPSDWATFATLRRSGGARDERVLPPGRALTQRRLHPLEGTTRRGTCGDSEAREQRQSVVGRTAGMIVGVSEARRTECTLYMFAECVCVCVRVYVFPGEVFLGMC